jgi:Zn-dependent metalloprotease
MNTKKLFIFTLVFLVCCFMTTSSWAAKKTDIYKSNAKDFIKKLNENGNKMGKAFGLSKDADFQLVRQQTDFNGVTHYRYQQTIKGIPVWGIRTVVSKDGANDKVIKLHGAVIEGAPNDVGSIPKKLDAPGALKKMKENHKAEGGEATWFFENETYGTYVYFHKKSKKARLCYVVSFFADNDCGNPSRPVFFVDAKNGKVIDSFDSLAYGYQGTGPGGNQKVGQYEYGTSGHPAFGVSVNGSTCTMNYADVKSVNLNHGTSGSTAYSYTCYRNTFKTINGAYSPINDAQSFGQVVYDMYDDWYGVPVLPFQLMMRVHYSTNYENAFWNGSSMTFGDGYSTFYPLVCLDVSAHEVAHGFTENNSDLTYSGQSGGINEAYSDMAGESAEYYSRGSTDYRCGYDIFKSPSGALRYLYNPPLDGRSIDHVDDYYSGMDVHYSSGVFNKAFYLIATTSGWNTRMAFDIFTRANQVYWTASTNFQQGGEGVQDAADDYGYNCQDVADAFAVVGVSLSCGGGGSCPTPSCPSDTVGYTSVYGSTTTTANRRAMSVTMPENGTIECISMYHTGGSGNMILGLYDGSSLPNNRLGVTASTLVCSSTGWQNIELTSPTYVSSGTKVWLAWVYQSNPGIYYQSGTPGRAHSSSTWSGGMPDPFGSSSTASYVYSIYASYTPSGGGGPHYGEVGNTSVFGSTSTAANRRAMPFTMPENGTIESVTMYHTGGSGNMILAVYNGSSAPNNRLAVTNSTAVSGSTGWQTINLTSTTYVTSGSPVWLAWVYQSNPGIRYQTGSPGRYQSSQTWSGGMPNPFGSGSQSSYLYSIYATYLSD